MSHLFDSPNKPAAKRSAAACRATRPSCQRSGQFWLCVPFPIWSTAPPSESCRFLSKRVLAWLNTGPKRWQAIPHRYAYQAFEILAQRGEPSPDTLIGWRKLIGLRNALVHDYLNIDPDIIRNVIAQGYSYQLFTFAEQGLDLLAAHID
ncbi:DUF86 domain-containing protein [Aeromonas media]|uniref:DUF86 domain-containing protein n=1 Tax=Aeromonas media TaxID=651 RepID=UPI00223F5B8E|nr:DUF86 domain-containing protein [Aeromonas media]